MKTTFFTTTIFLIFLILSCGKNDRLETWSLSEIVETDGQGNIINTPLGSNDWIPNVSDEYGIFDLYSDFLCQRTYSNTNEMEECENYTLCSDTSGFNLLIYQNPVPSGSVPILKLNTTKDLKRYTISARVANSDGSSENYTSDLLPVGIKSINQNLPDFQFRDGNDIELFITILTHDSCFIYYRGKIKYL